MLTFFGILMEKRKGKIMVKTRSANETIKGYFYQFDTAILKLLEEENEDAIIVVEGVEDVDIEKDNGSQFIQCKYYEKTSFNNGLIKGPIREMYKHFLVHRKDKNFIYKIYGFYKTTPVNFEKPDVEKLMKIFLEFDKYEVIEKDKHYYQIKNKKGDVVFCEQFSQNDVEDFLDRLIIDINAESFESQLKSIFNLIKKNFSDCDTEEEANLIYCNALKIIKDLAIQNDDVARKISKKEFISRIPRKEYYFEKWMFELYEYDNYLKNIHKANFKKVSNVSKADRIFLLDCKDENISDIKSVIHKVIENFSRINHNFCPYILLYNIDNSLVKLKKKLYSEKVYFKDGYPFKNASFEILDLLTPPTNHNGIRVKIIDNKKDLNVYLKEKTPRKLIFEFYKENSEFQEIDEEFKSFKIKSLNDVKKII